MVSGIIKDEKLNARVADQRPPIWITPLDVVRSAISAVMGILRPEMGAVESLERPNGKGLGICFGHSGQEYPEKLENRSHILDDWQTKRAYPEETR
jgi:hypothetical protein